MVGSRVRGRPAPSVLLIGFILLVASHLLGALHGPGFLGPHAPLMPLRAVQPTTAAEAVEVAGAEATGSDHEHHHEVFEDTVEHAIDRVRVSADGPLHAPQPVEPVIDQPFTHASPDRAGPDSGLPWPPGGRSACARHCVWRQ